MLHNLLSPADQIALQPSLPSAWRFRRPGAIAKIAWYNKAVVYDLLFKAFLEMLLRIAADPSIWDARRHHRRAPPLGLGDDHDPSHPHDRARRRHEPGW